MAITRINNNQITDATAGNIYLGVNAASKVQDYSITAGKIQNNLTYGSDLTITGNLTVQGNTTTIDTVNLVVEDPLILLAKEQTGSPTLDIGFIGKRGTEDNIAWVWDESADEFVAAFTTSEVTNSTITINSYASVRMLDLTANNANISGNITFNGTIDGSIDVTGNITGGNLISDAAINGVTITASGNVNGGNAVITGDVSSATVTASGNIDGANVNASAGVTAGTTVIATGNVSGGNLTTAGQVTATGNVNGGNLVTAGNIDGANVNATSGITAGTTIVATGNVSGGNITTAGDVTTATVTASGNVSGGNINTAGQMVATGNVSGGNLTTAGQVTATGNVSGGNITTAGDVTTATVTASGNVSGGNLVTAGTVDAGSVTASTTVSATGNVTGGNVNTSGQVVATGNVTGGNLVTAGDVTTATVTASGNVTGGNIETAGVLKGATLETTGNALIGGNLVVQGNITYINIDDLRVEDPIIILGTGPNGAPLTVDDGKDRGIYMEYYTTGLGNAYMGWQNSSGNMIIANDVEFSGNDVVQINAYGTLEVGNIYAESIVSQGNISGNFVSPGSDTQVLFNDGGLIAGDSGFTYNKSTDTVTLTGNVSGGNITTAGQVTATGNVSGGNITTAGNVDGANVNATSGITAGTTIVATGNVSGGNITTAGQVTATGNVSGGNVTTAGQVTATGNVSGGNLTTAGDVTTATVTASGNIVGGNLNTANGVFASTGFFTGNVDVLGNLNASVGIVYANSGIFLGDAVTGNNAAFAGIPAFTPLGSNVVMQFAGNVNSYSQLNFQNVNNGTSASTDYIATADNGDDSNYYVNMGINSSTFDDASYAGFYPNDSYLHNHGGNLILNPETAGKTLKFMVGGTDDSDVIGTVSTSGLTIVGTVDADTANIGNLAFSGDGITSDTGEVVINEAGGDVNFRAEGDTDANLFVVDAGSDTVLIGTGTPVTGAKLNIGATDSMIVPIGNIAQRPGSPTLGMFRFSTTDDGLEIYTSTGWEAVGVPAFTVITADEFAGNGVQTQFTLSEDSTTAATIVSINGIVQIPTTAYSVSGNVLTFTEAPALTDVIDARTLTTTTTVVALQNASGNARIEGSSTSAAFDITGNLVPTANVTYDLGSSSLRWRDAYFSGSSITLGNIVMKNTGGNSIGFFGPDGTTPATLDANVSVVGDAIESGTSNVSFAGGNGNVLLVAGGNTTGVITATGANVAGYITATGNISGGNLSGTSIVGTLTTAAQTNITSVGTLGSLTVTGNVSGGNLVTAGAVSTTEIQKTGSNGVGNIGSTSNYFNTVFAKATSAQYADLAEMYEADADIAPGTVVCFGGTKEVTVCDVKNSKRVAGVVSTNPSYLMNSALEGDHVAAVALTGRVPCRVIGPVAKGDLMVSAGGGAAMVNNDAAVGTVIGKALEDFAGDSGVIEVVVGRF